MYFFVSKMYLGPDISSYSPDIKFLDEMDECHQFFRMQSSDYELSHMNCFECVPIYNKNMGTRWVSPNNQVHVSLSMYVWHGIEILMSEPKPIKWMAFFAYDLIDCKFGDHAVRTIAIREKDMAIKFQMVTRRFRYVGKWGEMTKCIRQAGQSL